MYSVYILLCSQTMISLFLLDMAAKRRKAGPPQPKNPISTLNELRPGLVYSTMAMNGPSHAPVFTVSVEVRFNAFVKHFRDNNKTTNNCMVIKFFVYIVQTFWKIRRKERRGGDN